MDTSNPRHIVDPTAQPLVVGSRPIAYATWRVAAHAILAFAVITLPGLICVALVFPALLVPSHKPMYPVVATIASMVLAIALPGLLVVIAVHRLRYLRSVDRFRMVIGQDGLALIGPPLGMLPWDGIDHIMVTDGPPIRRRLLIDDGRTGAHAEARDASIHGLNELRRVFGRRRFTVDVPIDALDVEAGDVIRAIRHYSGGRFPDL